MKISAGWIIGGVAALIGAGIIVWFLSFRPSTPAQTTVTQSSGLGLSDTQTVGTSQAQSAVQENGTQQVGGATSVQKVFKIADGPITGASFVQTFNPTTTLARFVLQENGHVQDQPIDVPGSLPRAVSNTTIPGTAEALWGPGGSVVYLQYLDSSVIKTLSIIFPPRDGKTTVPPSIQFFPDNISDLAVAPSGSQVAYLVKTASGSDTYLANPDASNAKKLFSLPLSQLSLSWPSAAKLLVGTLSADGVPGMLFSADTKTGGVVPLIYAQDLTGIADSSFTHLVYQALSPTGDARYTYVHNIAKNTDNGVSFDPIPEKCAWSTVSAAILYCAVPNQYVNASYLDLWHQGAATAADALMRYDITTGENTRIAVPGGSDGGVASDISDIAVSPGDKYLLFVVKGSRSLWGVRLAQ